MYRAVGRVRNVEYHTDINGIGYGTCNLDVERRSGKIDSLLLRWKQGEPEYEPQDNDIISVRGSLRKYETGSIPKYNTTIYSRQIQEISEEGYEGLKGTNLFESTVRVFQLKSPRQTPNGITILDSSAILTRKSGDTDKVDIIFWNDAAIAASYKLKEGMYVKITGSLQERKYIKEGNTYSTYEISCYKFEEV